LTDDAFPWHSAIQELALARSRSEWAKTLEYLGCQLSECERSHFLVWREDIEWWRPSNGELPSANEGTLLGQAWSESMAKQASDGCLFNGLNALAPAWALPMRSFGRVVGFLTLEKVAQPPDLVAWQPMLDMMALSWETVGRLEDHLAYQQQSEELVVRALENMPSYRAGHVQRVAQMASELGRLLDLSASQRNRLKRAGTYHDVGLLISATDHAGAGAQFLRDGKLLADLASLVEHHHAHYGEVQGLGLEEWTLALAEHFQEFCEAQPVGQPADQLVQRFAHAHGARHNPAVLDALVGLSVAGTLDNLLPT
jgi:hypothetical protein